MQKLVNKTVNFYIGNFVNYSIGISTFSFVIKNDSTKNCIDTNFSYKKLYKKEKSRTQYLLIFFTHLYSYKLLTIYKKLGESGQWKIYSKLLEIKKINKINEKPSTGLIGDVLDFLSNIGLSITNTVRLVSIFNYDERTQELINIYNPPIGVLNVCYKYRKEETFPKVFEEILKRGYTIIHI